ncbi:MAG: hypothetical protein ACM3X7_00975 [Solirubrobacterales bacterium]
MKVLAQPIEVISYTNDKGDIRPLRFRIQIGDEPMQVMKIDKIIFKQKEKLAGNPMILYRCQSMNGDIEKVFEIKYEIDTCRWMLYKI